VAEQASGLSPVTTDDPTGQPTPISRWCSWPATLRRAPRQLCTPGSRPAK
jgi:hypothetical protein